MVQRAADFAIVDEVDNILIDEARTPLIISGARARRRRTATTSSRKIVRTLQARARTTSRREDAAGEPDRRGHRPRRGAGRHPRGASIYDERYVDSDALPGESPQGAGRSTIRTRTTSSATARSSSSTSSPGRMMDGRRYSEGLHQAIEAKEGVAGQAREPSRWRRSPSRTTSACTRSSPA